jgi:hypothetical protein
VVSAAAATHIAKPIAVVVKAILIILDAPTVNDGRHYPPQRRLRLVNASLLLLTFKAREG